MWKKKKKIEEPQEETLPEADDETEDTDEPDVTKYDKKIEELNAKIVELSKKTNKIAEKKEKKQDGEFNLSEEEMALAINALANSEEFKLYRQMVIGQQIAAMITEYNNVVSGRHGKEQEEDSDERSS